MTRLWIATALFALVAALPAQSQRVVVDARFVPATAAPGSEVTLELRAKIDAGYHIYGSLETTGNPTTVDFDETGILEAKGPAAVPAGEKHTIIEGFDSYWIEGTAKIEQTFTVPAGASGEVEVQGVVSYMACTPDFCDPPAEAPFSATLRIGAAAKPKAQDKPIERGPFGGMLQGKKVTLTTKFVPSRAAPGSTVELHVTAEMEPNYHIYGAGETTGEPTELEIDETAGLVAQGEPEVPVGKLHDTLGIQSFWIEGSGVIKQKFKVPADASGELVVEGAVSYMACTPDFCDPPDQVGFDAVLQVSGEAVAQDPAPKQDEPKELGPFGGMLKGKKVELTTRIEPAQAPRGGTVELIVKATVDPGYHVYGSADTSGSPTTLTIDDPAGLGTAGEAVVPAGEMHETLGIVSFWIEGEFEIRQKLTVPVDAEPGVKELMGSLTYMACTPDFCDPEDTVGFEAELTVTDAVVAAAAQPAEPTTTEPAVAAQQPIDTEADGLMNSWWALILAGIGAGLLALVMPCTYPMIPITFSFFTKQADARGGKVLPLALIYGLGIISIFIIIGVLVGPAIVPFATHWVTNLIIALAFLFFAFALFGLIYLQPPQWLMNAADRASTKGGLVGVFLMGATLVVTSFTCTVPFVGTMLSVAAKGGLDRVIVGMAVFGATMAIPFVALALLPGKMKALPRSGEWMNTIKVSLGFIELAAALKFFSNVDLALDLRIMPKEVFLYAWTAIFTVLALYLLGVFELLKPRASKVRVGASRLASAILSIGFAIYCAWGAQPKVKLDIVMTAMAPPYSLSGYTESDSIIQDDYERAIELANAQGKLLMVNFTGKL